MSETTIVKSASQFPNWKEPCPFCKKSKIYDEKKGKEVAVIGTRMDNTGAWCKACKHNWAIGEDPRPAGWQETGAKLGAKTSPEPLQRPQTQQNGWDVVVEHLTGLEAEVKIMGGTIEELNSSIKGLSEKISKLSILDQNNE
jgi:glutaredoxin